MTKRPVSTPLALGVKVTFNVQFAPAASTDGQLFVCAKSLHIKPFTLTNTGSAALPVLVRVTALAPLVKLTGWIPKSMEGDVGGGVTGVSGVTDVWVGVVG